MTARSLALGAALLGWGLAPAGAGEVLQLPSGSFTTTTTTVSAPDGGTVLLGGISRLSEGSTERGVPILGKIPGVNRLFKNRGIGRETQALTMTVTPRIIILEEEEERQVGQVLAERARAGGPRPPHLADIVYQRRAAFLAMHVQKNGPADHRFEPAPLPAEDPFAEVEDIRRRNEAARVQREQEAATFFEKGRQAEQEGKSGAAKVYYQMVVRRADGPLLEEARSRLASLSENK